MMQPLWNIFKPDGSVVGPMSAAEVRVALRDGLVDPFDQVCRTDSRLKRALVEVDEIFLTTEDNRDKVDSIYEMPEDEKRAINDGVKTQVATAESAAISSDFVTRVSKPHKSTRRSAETPSFKKKNKGSPQAKKHAKRFHLLDKRNRLLGPLSAAEIQSLFYRGVIDKDVMVVKDKGQKRVPVQQFISAYAGASAKRFKSQHTRLHLNPTRGWAYPSSRVMDQITRTAAVRIQSKAQFPWLSFLLLVVVAAAAGFAAKRYLLPMADRGVEASKSEIPEYPEKIEIKAVAPNTIEVEPDFKSQKTVNLPPPKKKVEKVDQKGKLKRPTAPPKSRPKAVSVRRRPKPVVRRSYPAPRYSKPRPKPPAARPTSRRAPLLTDTYGPKVGKTVTIAGARYSVASVVSCSGVKCSVPFQDSLGRTLSAVFFKAQYAGALRQKGGKATFTGRLDKKGRSYIIYLQSVR